MASSWTWTLDDIERSSLDGALRQYFRRALPEHESEELAAEVWLSIVRWYRGRGALHSFAFTVARKLTYDLVNRRKRPRFAALRSSDDLPAPGHGPESVLLLLAQHDALERELTKVPEAYREVVQLWLSGRSSLQIAAELGLAYNTVRSRLSRGRAHLVGALREVLASD